jgi:predicted lysophospholipase L1 biosynthesis ABC-type transport system permease subunit
VNDPGERPVDVTVPALVATGVLLLAVTAAYGLGAIPRPLAAASTAALALVLVLFGLSVVELVDSRLATSWTTGRLPDWWRHPSMPIVALAVGVLIGYFFW